MKVIKVKDFEEMSKVCSDIVVNIIANNPYAVLGLATGGTPEGLYKNLIESYESGDTDWKKVKTFNLDEYIGIPINHELSYHSFMKKNLFDHVNIDQVNNTHIPNPIGNIESNIVEYENLIKKSGGIDLQILGIGENAHIAFNEPGSMDDQNTRVVDLTDSTVKANSRYFKSESDVPRKAITMGIGTILKSKKIILLASGIKKAKAIKDTIEGEITPDVPSSFLKNHKDVTLIIDKDAASLLEKF